jgi:hypothetical protein
VCDVKRGFFNLGPLFQVSRITATTVNQPSHAGPPASVSLEGGGAALALEARSRP